MKSSSRLVRRLMPLFIAIGLQNFVLWYSIEKLFMTSIGFDNASIAIMASVYAGTMLLFETPSGLLADRWSRKGVLIIAGVMLAVASLIGGLSQDIWQYFLSAFSWGIFFALYSGSYDAIIYDTLLEETGSGKGFEKYSGRLHAFGGVFLVIGSVLGGIIGASADLRTTYFVTVPIALLSVFFLYLMREPSLHKKQEHVSLGSQVTSTFKAISTKGAVLWISVSLVLILMIDQVVFEFNQLWLIALAAPVVAYGPANGLLLSAVTIAGLSASTVSSRRRLIRFLLVLAVISVFCLALVQNLWVVVIATFIIGTVLIIYEIIFTKLLNDRLSSNIRAGAMSATSSISKLIFIPVALSFGFLSESSGVFNASWILVVLVIILAVIMTRALQKVKELPVLQSGELIPDEPQR